MRLEKTKASPKNLKEALQEIELALLTERYEEAEGLYEAIFTEWPSYVSLLRDQREEINDCLALVEHLDALLLKKKTELLEKQNSLKVRKAYTKG